MSTYSWHVAHEGRQQGPFTLDELSNMVRAGTLGPAVRVWRNGLSSWVRADEDPELTGLIGARPRGGPPTLAPFPGAEATVGKASALAARVSSRARAFLWTHVIGLFSTIVGALAISAFIEEIGIVLFFGGLASLAVSIVLWFMTLHGAWSVVAQDPREPTRMTPGKAVGLCFVPLFNIYWVWPAIAGLAGEFDRRGRARGEDFRPPKGLATCICLVMVPFVNYVMAIPALIMQPILACRLATSSERLAARIDAGC